MRNLINSNCQISKATAFSICESCEEVSEISDHKLSKYLKTFQEKAGMKFNKYNHKVDIWALGHLFFELLTGKCIPEYDDRYLDPNIRHFFQDCIELT